MDIPKLSDITDLINTVKPEVNRLYFTFTELENLLSALYYVVGESEQNDEIHQITDPIIISNIINRLETYKFT